VDSPPSPRYRAFILSVSAAVLLLTTLLACSNESAAEKAPSSGEQRTTKAPAPEVDAAVGGAEAAAEDVVQAPPVGPTDPAQVIPPGPVHPVYSLFDNRFLAHPIREGGLACKLGAPEGAKYNWGGHPAPWVMRRTVDEIPVAFSKGTGSEFFVPLSDAQAANAALFVVHLKNLATLQQVKILFNDQELGSKGSLDLGWMTLSFPIPEGLAKPGENKVLVKFSNTGSLFGTKAGGALAQVAILPRGAVEPTKELDLSYGTDAQLAEKGLMLPTNGGLAYYLFGPQQGALKLRFAAPEGCALQVSLALPGVEVATHVLEAQSDEPFAEAHLDLSPYQGRVFRLELTATTSSSCSGIEVRDAALVIPGEGSKRPTLIPPPQNVVIWMIDTLRADHLPMYNPKTDVQTPNLAAFAQTATLFERAYVEGTESKVSHASLFTGLYPIRHGHLSGDTRVANQFELIPEAAKRAGLLTAGYISNGYVSDTWGFNQGFDDYVNTIRESKRNNAVALTARAKDWVEKHVADRFFLYLGTIDPHVAYNRHEEFIKLYDADDARWANTPWQWNCTGVELEGVITGRLAKRPEERERVHALYKNEISYNDHYFGELMAELAAKGLLDKTMVIVVADHGDEFWEHGSAGHARTLFEEIVRVPLIVRYPPLFPATRVAEGVDVLDLAPTLTDALGIPASEGVQGASLVDLANGVGRGYPRPAIATQKNVSYTMLLNDWKVILRKSGESELYDLAADPMEQTDVAQAHPVELRWVLDALGLFLAYDREWDKSVFGVSANLSAGFPNALSALEVRNR